MNFYEKNYNVVISVQIDLSQIRAQESNRFVLSKKVLIKMSRIMKILNKYTVESGVL